MKADGDSFRNKLNTQELFDEWSRKVLFHTLFFKSVKDFSGIVVLSFKRTETFIVLRLVLLMFTTEIMFTTFKYMLLVSQKQLTCIYRNDYGNFLNTSYVSTVIHVHENTTIHFTMSAHSSALGIGKFGLNVL